MRLRAGTFVLASSSRIAKSDAVRTYFVRLGVEDYIETVKEFAGLVPVRRHDTSGIEGRLLVTFAASALAQSVRNDLAGTGMGLEQLLKAMRNQKCRVYEDGVIVDECTPVPKCAYEKFGYKPPIKIPFSE